MIKLARGGVSISGNENNRHATPSMLRRRPPASFRSAKSSLRVCPGQITASRLMLRKSMAEQSSCVLPV